MKCKENLKEYMRIPETLRETVAEGVAYVVLNYLGLKSKAPQYLAIQGVSKQDIKRWAGHIASASNLLLSYLLQRAGGSR